MDEKVIFTLEIGGINGWRNLTCRGEVIFPLPKDYLSVPSPTALFPPFEKTWITPYHSVSSSYLLKKRRNKNKPNHWFKGNGSPVFLIYLPFPFFSNHLSHGIYQNPYQKKALSLFLVPYLSSPTKKKKKVPESFSIPHF